MNDNKLKSVFESEKELDIKRYGHTLTLSM